MNTRFAVAAHILTILASQNGEPATSDMIASSVGTNPSLIRRLLTQLTRAGLASAQRGSGGGAVLARPAQTITLRDVYRAVDEDAEMIPVHQTSSPKCPIGRHIQAELDAHVDAAANAMLDTLAQTTIADLTSDVMAHERQS